MTTSPSLGFLFTAVQKLVVSFSFSYDDEGNIFQSHFLHKFHRTFIYQDVVQGRSFRSIIDGCYVVEWLRATTSVYGTRWKF
jgi:hypothetical protein